MFSLSFVNSCFFFRQIMRAKSCKYRVFFKENAESQFKCCYDICEYYFGFYLHLLISLDIFLIITYNHLIMIIKK